MAEKRTQAVIGRKQLIDKMRRRLGAHVWSADVGARSSRRSVTYTYPSGRSHTTVPRGFNNSQILEYQAKRGRNPVFLTPSEQDRGKAIWSEAIRSFLAGNDGAIVAGATRLAEYYVSRVKQHIIDGVGEDGALRPVKDFILKSKEARARAAGHSVGGPLVDTGQLLASLFGAGGLLR